MAETIDQYAARMAKAGGGELRRILYREAGKVAMRAERAAKLNTSRRLNVRSGRLRASIRTEVKSTSSGLDVRLMAGGSSAGGKVTYARKQEKGGTIKSSRKGGMLAIPLGPAKTPAGVSRYKSPRDVGGLVLVTSRAGNLILLKPGEGPYYVLKESVTIKGKHYLRDAMRTAAKKMPAEVRKAFRLTLVGV